MGRPLGPQDGLARLGKVGKAPGAWLGAEMGLLPLLGQQGAPSTGAGVQPGTSPRVNWSTLALSLLMKVTVTVWPETVTAIMRSAPFMGTLHGPTHLIPTGP